MGQRKYEDPFFQIQVLSHEPMQIDDLVMNEEELTADAERFEAEMQGYLKETGELIKLKNKWDKLYLKDKLNGKMMIESLYVREVQKLNKARREANEPLISLNPIAPQPLLKPVYLSLPNGKRQTITDIEKYVVKAQFLGAIVKPLGLLAIKTLEEFAAEKLPNGVPAYFIFTSLESSKLNEDEDEEDEPCSDCGGVNWMEDPEDPEVPICGDCYPEGYPVDEDEEILTDEELLESTEDLEEEPADEEHLDEAGEPMSSADIARAKAAAQSK